MAKTKTSKNLLEQKLELKKKPWYTSGEFKNNPKMMKDYEAYRKIEAEISKTWIKHPDWLISGKFLDPHIPADKLPAKGTKVLFINFDKVRDKSQNFGFRIDNYRVEEGVFEKVRSQKEKGDYDPAFLCVVVISGGYRYQLSADSVILK